jgi:pyruvate-ferredoxin/flavodoxin oxidoreductase
MNSENRFKMLKNSHPEIAKQYYDIAQTFVEDRFKYYDYLANRKFENEVTDNKSE